MTQCTDVYKEKNQSDLSIDTLKLIIVVRGNVHNKELFGDTWSPTASMRTIKYLLENAVKNKARVHQLHLLEH